MYPLAFCRECGQEHYLCSLAPGKEGKELLPRSPLLHVTDDDLPGTPGFVSLEDGSLWNEAEDLPDNFVEVRKGGPRIKAHYAAHVPQRIWVTADGKTSRTETDGALAAWWQPRPLMLCLRCRAAYDLRESDFRKLVTLSQTGRSTATTVIGTTVVTGLPEFGSREIWRAEPTLELHRQPPGRLPSGWPYQRLRSGGPASRRAWTRRCARRRAMRSPSTRSVRRSSRRLIRSLSIS